MENKTIHLKLGKGLSKKIDEMNEYYSTNNSELIRMALNDYYDSAYRIGRFGHQSGTGKKKDTKQKTAIEEINNILSSNDEIKTEAYLRKIGYLQHIEVVNNHTCKILKDPTLSILGVYPMDKNGEPLALYSTLIDLKEDIEKHLQGK